MRRKKLRILVCALIVVIVAVVLLWNRGPQDFRDKYVGTDLSTDVAGIGRDDTYEVYLKAYETAARSALTVPVDIAAFEGDGRMEPDAQGNAQVYTQDGDTTAWKVQPLPTLLSMMRQPGQRVVDTGLYGIVRHPMYSATLLLFLSMPLVLGSVYSFLIFLAYPLIIAKRIRGEEEFLEKELDGYRAYKEKVKYRLIPFVW